MLAYGFDNNANKLGTRFAVAANEAIRLAHVQAGEEGLFTFGDVLDKYKDLQVAITEMAEHRHEQLSRQKREDAHYAAMSSYHRHVAAPPAASASYCPAAHDASPGESELKMQVSNLISEYHAA